MRQFICRFCSAKNCSSILDLNETALANSYVSKEKLFEEEYKYKLHFSVCNTCSLIQVDDSVPAEKIFSDYAYFSSSSTSEDVSLEKDVGVTGLSHSPSLIGFTVHLWKYLMEELQKGRQEGIGSWLFGSMGDCDVGDAIYLSFLCFGCVFIFAPPNLSSTKPTIDIGNENNGK